MFHEALHNKQLHKLLQLYTDYSTAGHHVVSTLWRRLCFYRVRSMRGEGVWGGVGEVVVQKLKFALNVVVSLFRYAIPLYWWGGGRLVVSGRGTLC